MSTFPRGIPARRSRVRGPDPARPLRSPHRSLHGSPGRRPRPRLPAAPSAWLRASLPTAFAALLLALLALPGARAQAPGGSAAGAVWIVPIEAQITPATARFVESRVARANDEGPLALVLLIDTPGGSVAAMEDIVEAVLNEARVPTIAVVENAFSAGALIAMSAESLAMLPGSSIGAALPILATPVGIRSVDEKFSSALRGQFRSVAEARGRDPRVAEGMVDERVEIPGIATSEELVTLTAEQAVEAGIADLQARSLRDALDQLGYGGAALETLEPTTAERLGAFLARPIVAAILLAIGIGGIVLELFTPGLGIPGAIGALALVLLASAAFVATPAGAVDVLLIVVGVLLFAAELLVIPGFGIAGVLGAAAIVIAVIRIFEDSAIDVLGWTALFSAGLIVALIVLLPNERFASQLKLRARLAASGAPDASGAAPDPRAALAGRRGVALTDLRPAGLARVDGERLDVVSQGDWVASGTEVEVLRVEGSRVVVRATEASAPPAPPAEPT